MESNDKLEQLLRQMYAKEALHDDDIDTSDIIDEEWTKFEAKHFGSEKRKVRSEKSSFLKIAAMFIGVLMLSGIAYAAIHIVSNHVGGDMKSSAQEVQVTNSRQQQNDELPADSTAMQPKIYEDVELATILDDIATFHQVEPVYKKEDSKHIRLYFTWDKKQTIDNLIDTFNKFERIHITRHDNILIIE
jgi:hypothetical protein